MAVTCSECGRKMEGEDRLKDICPACKLNDLKTINEITARVETPLPIVEKEEAGMSNLCTVEGCSKLGPAEGGLCYKHYREKHGVTYKPAKRRAKASGKKADKATGVPIPPRKSLTEIAAKRGVVKLPPASDSAKVVLYVDLGNFPKLADRLKACEPFVNPMNLLDVVIVEQLTKVEATL